MQQPSSTPIGEVRVVGLGQHVAGDDGVGLVVIQHLKDLQKKDQLIPEVRLHTLADASQLLPLLEDASLVVIVDALVSADVPPFVELTPAELSTHALSTVSSHGMGVAQVLELASTLSPRSCSDVRVIGIRIEAPNRFVSELSPQVRAQVPLVAQRICQVVQEKSPSSRP